MPNKLLDRESSHVLRIGENFLICPKIISMDILDEPQETSQNYLTVEEVLQRGYRFRFSEYFDKAIDILKNNVGAFVLASLIYFGIVLILAFIPFVGTIANIFIAPALIAGFVLMAHKASTGQKPIAGDIFLGFRGGAYGKILVAYILTILITIGGALLTLPIVFLAGPDIGAIVSLFGQLEAGVPADVDDFMGLFRVPGILWLLILVAVVLVYLTIMLSLAIPFAALHAESGWDAVRSSFRIVRKSGWWFLIYLWLLSICSSLGILALCVGILVTYPIAMIGSFTAFDHIMRGNSSVENT